MRSSPLVTSQDRFAAAALQIDRLLTYLRKRRDRHPDAREARWDHCADSAAGVFSYNEQADPRFAT